MRTLLAMAAFAIVALVLAVAYALTGQQGLALLGVLFMVAVVVLATRDA